MAEAQPTARDTKRMLDPKAVVAAAYIAANAGRYKTADTYVAASFTRGLRRAARASESALERNRRVLACLRGRRDAKAVRLRKVLRAFQEAHREFAKLDLGSSRFSRSVWIGVTRKRSLAKVEATRQVIRGRHARVYLKLTLADGSVVRDSESLVFERGRWLIG